MSKVQGRGSGHLSITLPARALDHL